MQAWVAHEKGTRRTKQAAAAARRARLGLAEALGKKSWRASNCHLKQAVWKALAPTAPFAAPSSAPTRAEETGAAPGPGAAVASYELPFSPVRLPVFCPLPPKKKRRGFAAASIWARGFGRNPALIALFPRPWPRPHTHTHAHSYQPACIINTYYLTYPTPHTRGARLGRR